MRRDPQTRRLTCPRRREPASPIRRSTPATNLCAVYRERSSDEEDIAAGVDLLFLQR
eukprot:CAMPEP_0117680268 /NCGR_PEP_ID=MMETSP0804-20121206/18258_1 /TAXON_ID=1074897 /ORGANISM="Tetraselmis astigmatica, Strain CCMP880" /LENGTH=56 /DNA_ID=CAMNT_0005489747 /DNA_START=121 /DNA_END=287 /DNA_ORIENTATION=-